MGDGDHYVFASFLQSTNGNIAFLRYNDVPSGQRPTTAIFYVISLDSQVIRVVDISKLKNNDINLTNAWNSTTGNAELIPQFKFNNIDPNSGSGVWSSQLIIGGGVGYFALETKNYTLKPMLTLFLDTDNGLKVKDADGVVVTFI
jgi:hypothetical protein